VAEIKELFGKAAPKMGATHLVNNKKLGGEKEEK